MLNIALIGAGGHSATLHAPAIKHFCDQHPGLFNLAVVCDPDIARANAVKNEFDFGKVVADIGDVFSGLRIDAAITAVSVPAILSVAEAFLQRGIPLMIEKPLGANLAEAHELVRLAQRTKTPSMVSVNRRFDPGLKIALDWVRSQGPVRRLHACMLRVGRTEPEFLWTTAIHLIDTVCYVSGPVRFASGPLAYGAPGDCWRSFNLESDEIPFIHVEIMPDCGRNEERLRIAGDDYCVDVWVGSPHPWRVEGYAGGKLVLHAESAPDEAGYLRNGTYEETAEFLGALAENCPPPGPSPQDVIPATELIARLYGITLHDEAQIEAGLRLA